MQSFHLHIVPRYMTLFLLVLLASGSCLAQEEVRVMTWNIWHGGREDGKEVGPQRVVEVIRESKADIIAMQETYGSGEIISKGLGFHFHERGTNLSIHSRFPVLEDISVFEAFKCIGALIELPGGHRVAFYSIWLPYGEDIWLPGVRAKRSDEQLQAACEPSAADLEKMLAAIEERLSADKYQDVSIVIAGDFNSMSPNDYASAFTDQFERRIEWRTGSILLDHGFRDTYREANTRVDREQDSTWSPKFPEQEQDRIDFIFCKSQHLETDSSKVIRNHPIKFPSDHAAVLTTMAMKEPADSSVAESMQAMSYNIRHGVGTDYKLDLKRIAKVINEQSPDFVALQEIDMRAKRSGGVNQIVELGEITEMHPAFGAFMDYQGGRYGMGMLSRFPIKSSQSVRLPDGNEPRIALAVEVILPGGQPLMVVDVHFDWVSDDKYRWQQAEVVREFLNTLGGPYVLLGDFNDRKGSRTLKLLSENEMEAAKPESDRFTIPADKPRSEIDFVFVGPKSAWESASGKVVAEPLASDHRPVVAELTLKPTGSQ
ncbi:MAG: endonuclease/exonuclease/phosphatase family protein [Planctomycetota bacterium]